MSFTSKRVSTAILKMLAEDDEVSKDGQVAAMAYEIIETRELLADAFSLLESSLGATIGSTADAQMVRRVLLLIHDHQAGGR